MAYMLIGLVPLGHCRRSDLIPTLGTDWSRSKRTFLPDELHISAVTAPRSVDREGNQDVLSGVRGDLSIVVAVQDGVGG